MCVLTHCLLPFFFSLLLLLLLLVVYDIALLICLQTILNLLPAQTIGHTYKIYGKKAKMLYGKNASSKSNQNLYSFIFNVHAHICLLYTIYEFDSLVLFFTLLLLFVQWNVRTCKHCHWAREKKRLYALTDLLNNNNFSHNNALIPSSGYSIVSFYVH